MPKKYDFGGYATKFGVKCTDGRIINREAFDDCNGVTVPLVYQHVHDQIENVIGHADLEVRDDGVYAYGKLNETPSGQLMHTMINNGDLDSLSIYANQLIQNGPNVTHGVIREVSVVLAGANPKAKIDNLALAHADGSYDEYEDEAIFSHFATLDYIEHADDDSNDDSDDEQSDDSETVEDIYNSMNEKQKRVVEIMLGSVIMEYENGSDEDDDVAQSGIEEDTDMKKNAFTGVDDDTPAISQADVQNLMTSARSLGSFRAAFDALDDSQRNAFLRHDTYQVPQAGEVRTFTTKNYGISNIGLLFPDAHELNNPPEWIKRDTEWVAGVLAGVRHSPFSHIRTSFADITEDDARAKGYITGHKKKEEVFSVLRRDTTATTIYKKQKFDRDDIVDITDFDVIRWVQGEMRLMLNEEIARAILIGDGRSVASEDKINEQNIRPVWTDDDLYTMKFDVDATNMLDMIDEFTYALEDYEGSGNLTLFTTKAILNDMLLVRDTNKHRIYNGISELANAIGVNRIVTVPVLKNVSREVSGSTKYLYGLMVDLRDYTVGTNKGGEITSFQDFDIDYNQQKFLIETRMSGALTRVRSAVVLEGATQWRAQVSGNETTEPTETTEP